MSRQEKANYLLNGSSINRNDLDYYFYETRVDAITQFIRESTEKARKIKPDIEISAAVFINPMRSARNIGQRWTDFAPWLDIMATMSYRSHFQGSFEDYLVYLEDYARAQKKWCGGQSELHVGITGHYIYKEEREPWEAAMTLLDSETIDSQKDRVEKLMEENLAYLAKFSAERAKTLEVYYHSYLENKITKDTFREEIQKILSDPPPGFFPEEKLIRTIQTVKKTGVDGVAIFSAGIIQRNKLWPAVKKAFIQ